MRRPKGKHRNKNDCSLLLRQWSIGDEQENLWSEKTIRESDQDHKSFFLCDQNPPILTLKVLVLFATPRPRTALLMCLEKYSAIGISAIGN